MADAVLGVVTQGLLEKVLSLAAEEISLAWGVNKELRKLAEKLEMIQALLSDAQSKQLADNAVQLWLKRLQSVALAAEIVLDEFGCKVLRQNIESRKRDKVCNFFSSSNPFSFRRLGMAHKVKDVISSLEEVYAESNQIGLRPVELISLLPDLRQKRLTSPFVEDSEIVGRHDDISQVLNMLIHSDYHDKDLPVITILGMGGQGKTTLAQLVYNNDKVQSHFDKRVWVCVSDDFNVERLLAEILQSLTKSNSQLTNTEALVSKLKEELSGKRYLLVLDDVWNEDTEEWDRMRGCLLQIGDSKGSKVLATTRSEEVALAMQTAEYHRHQELSPGQSWELFENFAFAEGGATKTPELVDMGQRILKRCGGVPLAIRVIGSLLCSKNHEWEWSTIERSEYWNVSDKGKRILSAIKLSYDHLPTLSLKQCFAYCAIFEKDTHMEKDMLIQLWMAQGLLNPPKGSHLQMEDIGSDYFDILLRSSLLQDAWKDLLNNITHCKMHDLVHDVSLQVSKNYCFQMKDWKHVRNVIEAVHLSITAGEGGMWKSLKSFVPSNLRTLHLKGRHVLEEDLFANFKCLSVLIVEDEDAKELPNWIGKMRRLRFLDITSCHNIRRLPKSLTELYYLQTLRVDNLVEVPEGFPRKLINLRHFYVVNFYSSRHSLPRIGQLTNLQTLGLFEVMKTDGCQIEELEHLENLKGELKICGLQNVSSHESALKSNMSKKSNIEILTLQWDQRKEDCDDSDVMEGLKPHSSLKSLEIIGYQSPKFPSWMTTVARNDLKLLHNLVELRLEGLNKCEGLPSLGDLPCLEYLRIQSLDNVKCIGEELYGYGWSDPNPNVSDVVDWRGRKNNGEDVIILFPALKRLWLYNMKSVVEWSDAIVPTPHSSSVIIKAFPNLQEMMIWNLPMLRAFPNLGCLSSLQLLDISDCQSLTLSSNWNWVVKSPDIHYLQSLRHVKLEDCGEFTEAFCSLKILAPLQFLEIEDHPSLWPKDMHHLTNLRSLNVGGFSSHSSEVEVDCFPFFPQSISDVTSAPPLDVQYFPSLMSLTLNGSELPKVTSLSDQIQYLTMLKDLTIRSFHLLEVLPEWLGNLKSLQNLEVSYCKNLKQLPSAEAFQQLTNLQNLKIYYCPLLQERCTQGSGLEWPKIAHIPNLEFRQWW